MNRQFVVLLVLLCIFFTSIVSNASDSLVAPHNRTVELLMGDTTHSKIRGFAFGDSLTHVIGKEKSMLEAEGDDYLFYRVFCDSAFSAELSYTFTLHQKLISVKFEFHESCDTLTHQSNSGNFLKTFSFLYGIPLEIEDGYWRWFVPHKYVIEYKNEEYRLNNCRAEIEFYTFE